MQKFVFLIATLFSTSLWGWVFIQSEPLCADVFINGNLIGKTPLALTNTPSSFTLSLSKPGYTSLQKSIKINSRVTNFAFTLIPESFHSTFPGYEKISVNGKPFTASTIENLSLGTYTFSITNNTLLISKINPNKPFFYFSLGTAAAGLLAAGVGLIAGTFEYTQFQNAKTYEEAVQHMQASMFYDSMVSWGGAFALVSGGIAFVLYLDDQNFQKKANQFVVKESGYRGEDQNLYNQAMDALSRQDYDTAISLFEKMYLSYPESPYLSVSLYQWGKIYKNRKDYRAAESKWEKLLSSYPVIDLYELTLYELFDNALQENKFQLAESYLKILQSVRFLYSVEDNDWFEISLYRTWSKVDPSKRRLYEEKKQTFIETRSYSTERRQLLQKE